jgi:microcystin-dependent protein
MEPFMGLIAAFGFNFTPRGWASCSGQLSSIAQNSAMFALLGTMYGGDGIQTFGIPDLRGRTLVGMGTGPGLSPVVQGQMAGSQQVTITSSNMPQHNHTLGAARLSIANSIPDSSLSSGFLANTPSTQKIYAEGSNATSSVISGTTDMAGSSFPLGIMNPFLGINYCIAMEGIFPSRN